MPSVEASPCEVLGALAELEGVKTVVTREAPVEVLRGLRSREPLSFAGAGGDEPASLSLRPAQQERRAVNLGQTLHHDVMTVRDPCLLLSLSSDRLADE